MHEHLVVIGASRAGLFAVEGARRAGYQGAVTLVGAEPHLPYDRPPLSKDFLTATDAEPGAPVYRSDDALRDRLGVQLRLATPATRLDAHARTVWLGDEALRFTSLVAATGTAPRRLPGTDRLDGVLTLRTLDDARRIRAALSTRPRVVVVGAGLIGSEVAAAARERGSPVTMVEPLPVPLVRMVGAQSGHACARLHENNGTELRTGVTVTELKGSTRVDQVVLSDGTCLDADLVVVGVGVLPATGWLDGSGLEIDDGLVCDATLSTGVAGVYGAGDVVRYIDARSGRRVRLENWTSAAEQGRIAGRNAVRDGEPERFASVPYVWSDQYGHRLQFVGDAAADEIVTVVDSAGTGGYLALHNTDGRLTGAFGIDQTRVIPKLRAMIARSTAFDEARRATG